MPLSQAHLLVQLDYLKLCCCKWMKTGSDISTRMFFLLAPEQRAKHVQQGSPGGGVALPAQERLAALHHQLRDRGAHQLHHRRGDQPAGSGGKLTTSPTQADHAPTHTQACTDSVCVCQNPQSPAKNTSGDVGPTRDRETEGRNRKRSRRELESRENDLQTLVSLRSMEHLTAGHMTRLCVCVCEQDCSTASCLRLKCQVGRLERRKNAIVFIYSRLAVDTFLKVNRLSWLCPLAQVLLG